MTLAQDNVVWRLDRVTQQTALDSSLQASPVLQGAARAANWWGGDGVIWFAALLWLGSRVMGRRALAQLGYRGAEAIAIASALSGITKGLAGRARPFVTGAEPWHWDFNHGWSDAQYFSMPSGHTTATIAFASAVALATAGWDRGKRAFVALPLLISALLVGAARIYANQHWLSDVLVALALGTATSVALAAIHQRRRPSRYDGIMVGAGAVVVAMSLLFPGASAAQSVEARRGPAFTRGDATILGVGVSGSLVLIGWDRQIANRVRTSSLQHNPFMKGAMDVAGFAGDPGSLVAGAGLWIVGRARQNRTHELVGLRSLEAIAVSSTITAGVKALAGRARPDLAPSVPRDFVLGRGFGDRSEFQSFPSGHATAAFAFASAVDAELTRLAPGRPGWVVPLLYGVATATAASRVYHDRHWTSDVVLGSAIGFVGGRAVVRWHADRK